MARRLALFAVVSVLAAGCVSKQAFVARSQEADRAAAELAAERQRSAGLALRAAQLEGQLEEVKRALSEATAERERLSAALVSARGDAARLEGQLAEASDQRDTLSRQLAITRETASRKDVNLQQLAYKYDSLVKDLERQKSDLSRRATDLSGRLAEAESRIAALVSERDGLAGERLRLDVQAQDLATRLATSHAELARAREALGETREALAERERRLAETTRTYDTLVADLKGEIAEGQVRITRLRDRLTVNLVDKVLFNSGSTVIEARGQAVLRKVAEVLRTVRDKRIQIEGHTDDVPVGGSLKTRFPTNWELSAARATVVARFLEEQGGIDPTHLAAIGYGEHHPIASNETPEGRAENRRIEIVLTPLNLDAALR